jgi:hypothetical protein
LSAGRQEIAAGTDAIGVALKTAVQPNPTLGVLMQTVTAGAFLGTLFAYHADARTRHSTHSRLSLDGAWPVS